jgi:hypothetical protein
MPGLHISRIQGEGSSYQVMFCGLITGKKGKMWLKECKALFKINKGTKGSVYFYSLQILNFTCKPIMLLLV